MAIKNAFCAQSGGVASVINVSALDVIEACRIYSEVIVTLSADHNGIRGERRAKCAIQVVNLLF
jgi:hypothetical protein